MEIEDLPIIDKKNELIEYYYPKSNVFLYSDIWSSEMPDDLTEYSFQNKNIRIRKLLKEEKLFLKLANSNNHYNELLSKVRKDIADMIDIHGAGLVNTKYKLLDSSGRITKKYLSLCRTSKRYQDKLSNIKTKMDILFNFIIEKSMNNYGIK